MSFALEVSDLTVNYEKTPVLWDINLQVPSSQFVGIIGPNGAGKSTLLKAVMGLVRPLSGRILFFNHTLQEVRNKVAYVPQRSSVDWDFPITALELVLMGRYGKIGLFRFPTQADKTAALHYLDMVGMAPFAARQINKLSGGEQQRIFLARALLQEAEVYFLDEPFAGIDMSSENLIITLLQNLVKAGKTVFVVHHDLNTAEEYFDSLIVLNMRLIAFGKTHDIMNAETLYQAYGKSYALLDRTLKLSGQKKRGL